ncbi:MAG: sigma factor-like helix-turn-helix DNA-binding protein [Candidatus Binataceae bacterium]
MSLWTTAKGKAALARALSARTIPAFNRRLFCLLQILTPRELIVIERRFGLDGTEPKTLRELGLQWAITGERVRQIEEKARRKMRHKLYRLLVARRVSPHTLSAARRALRKWSFYWRGR